jgi:toxin CcdB
MARYDVHRIAGGTGFVLDCQADVLSGLNTRFVVPLLPPDEAPLAGERLNPAFTVAGEQVIMYTQFAASIPAGQLHEPVASLAEENLAIMNALDMLLSGY